MLDDFIDRTDTLRTGEKLLIKKLLKLRSREDDNCVLITVSGLSRLLGVNVKTIRTWLKHLEQTGFIIYKGIHAVANLNFTLKKYEFPVSFPGFDLAAVFIKRGAKARYKKKSVKALKVVQKRAKARAAKVESTCPICPPLLDCFSACNSSSSYSEEEITDARSAKPEASAPRASSISSETNSEIQTIIELNDGLKSLLRKILSQAGSKAKREFIRVSRFIERCCDENSTINTRNDRIELAYDLEKDLTLQFLPLGRKRRLLMVLFRFLDQYIANFCAASQPWQVRFHEKNVLESFASRGEQMEAFQREYPRCDYEGYTGINRM